MDLENNETLLFYSTTYLNIGDPFEVSTLKPLRLSYIKLRVRKRVTEDDGRSIIAIITSYEIVITFGIREIREE
jgi:hypothetical protein